MKLPAFQFYPGDWLKDPAVRALSFAARGLWIDMIAIMSECNPRGYLRLNGKPIIGDQLARMTGGQIDEVQRLLKELETAGVFSRDRHHTIYSRRIVRDERLNEVRRNAGKLGGNPVLLNQKLTTQVKQKPTPSSSSSSSSSLLPKKEIWDLPSKEAISESSEPQVEKYVNEIALKIYEEKIFDKVNVFINAMKKRGKNIRAILHTLNRCYEEKPEEPWSYCKKIIEVESGNYNERDYKRTVPENS